MPSSRQALIAIAREMGTKLIRSSYSNIVREAQDASAALFDARRQRRRAGRADPDAPRLDVGDLPRLRRSSARSHKLEPGDFYINNDPYGGGQHLQDVFIFTPIFVEGRHRRLRRHGGAPSRSRRRQSRHDAGCGRRARRGHHHPALALHLRRATGTAGRSSGWSRPTCACPRRPSATSMPSSPPTRSARRA